MTQDTFHYGIWVDGRLERVTLHFRSAWCDRLGIVGMVWRDHVHFAGPPAEVPAWVIAHELLHVWQWRTTGRWWRHVWRYLRSLRAGYFTSPYELQACQYQAQVATGDRVTLPGGSLSAPFLASWDRVHGPRKGWRRRIPGPPPRPQPRSLRIEDADDWMDWQDPGTDFPRRNNDHESDGA